MNAYRELTLCNGNDNNNNPLHIISNFRSVIALHCLIIFMAPPGFRFEICIINLINAYTCNLL